MTDRPILFSGPMVLALLARRKTQTRRVLTRLRGFGPITEFGPSDTAGFDWHFRDREMRWHDLTHGELLKALPYEVGDRRWVRETFVVENNYEYRDMWQRPMDGRPIKTCDGGPDWGEYELIPHYRATEPEPHIVEDGDNDRTKWRPSIFMPHWVSRITLPVTNVRVEPVASISGLDSIAEGVECETCRAMGESACRGQGCFASIQEYRDLWNSLNAKRGYGWDVNPWVVAATFEVHKVNIDQMERAAA